MPNWCNNIVRIEHKSKKAIDRVEKAYMKGALCNTFIPTPEELLDDNLETHNPETEKERIALRKAMMDKYGFSSWYDFRLTKWGTKWDIDSDDLKPERMSPHCILLTFDTAWAPPIGLFEQMRNEGYNVDAYFYEGGMRFCGKYTMKDGNRPISMDIPDDIERARETIPDDIEEMFDIVAQMELEKEFQEENEKNDGQE